MADVGLAVNDKRKVGEEWVEEVTFVDVTLWGRTAEVAAEYCAKGNPLFVEGRLKLETWEKDGQKNSKLKVIGEKIQLMGSKGDGTKNEGAPQNRSSNKPNNSKASKPVDHGDAFDDDSVPF